MFSRSLSVYVLISPRPPARAFDRPIRIGILFFPKSSIPVKKMTIYFTYTERMLT